MTLPGGACQATADSAISQRHILRGAGAATLAAAVPAGGTAWVSSARPTSRPQLAGTDEKWHIREGNDQLISEVINRLPAGTVRLGERLEAVRSRGYGTYTCTFSRGAASAHDVRADHVVFALPFTKLREVDLRGIGLPPLQRRAI